jgi:hypothetical protein
MEIWMWVILGLVAFYLLVRVAFALVLRKPRAK